MSQHTVVKCDGANCGKVRGEANHWINAAVVSDAGGRSLVIGSGIKALLTKCESQFNMQIQILDLCSQACLAPLIRQYTEKAQGANSTGTAAESADVGYSEVYLAGGTSESADIGLESNPPSDVAQRSNAGSGAAHLYLWARQNTR